MSTEQSEEVVVNKIRAPRKSLEPKHYPVGYVHKDLNKRVPVKVYPKVKKLHFCSAMSLLESLSSLEYTCEFLPERVYGFYPLVLKSRDGLTTFTTVTFNIHFHNFSAVVDDRGKAFGQLTPFPIEPNHIDVEYILTSQKQEETAILEVQKIFSSVMSLSDAAKATDGIENANVNIHTPVELSKLRIKLPSPKLKGKKFELDKMLKLVDNNNDLCIEVAGGWLVMKDDSANTYYTGVSFKILPWLHQWFYFPSAGKPVLGKRSASSKKRGVANTASAIEGEDSESDGKIARFE